MSIAQTKEEVKQCIIDWCHEEEFRDGLCWGHFVAERLMDSDDWDPALDGGWHGYDVEEVYGDVHHLPG